MARVGLRLRQEEVGPLADALAAAGYTVAGGEGDEVGDAETVVLEAREMEIEEVRRWVAFVVAGGVLILFGGAGALQAALHLTPGTEPLEGPVEAAVAGLPALDLAVATPVTGVGYALYRIGTRCVTLAGPRGEGWVGYAGAPAPPLIVACLQWIGRSRSCCGPDSP